MVGTKGTGTGKGEVSLMDLLSFLFWRSWSNDPLVDIRLLETRVIENAKKRRKEIHRDPTVPLPGKPSSPCTSQWTGVPVYTRFTAEGEGFSPYGRDSH